MFEVLCVYGVGQHTQYTGYATNMYWISKICKRKNLYFSLSSTERCYDFCTIQVMSSLTCVWWLSVTNVNVKLTEHMQSYRCRALPLLLGCKTLPLLWPVILQQSRVSTKNLICLQINHFVCNIFSIINTRQNHIEACTFLPLHAGKTHRC